MNKCLKCGKEIEQSEGKRKRLYCGSTCRSAHFQKKYGSEKKYVQLKTFEKEVSRLKRELELALSERSNPLINAARGRDENGVNNDEVRATPKSNEAASKLAEYEAELPTLGVGGFATQRKRYLEKSIKELKKQL